MPQLKAAEYLYNKKITADSYLVNDASILEAILNRISDLFQVDQNLAKSIASSLINNMSSYHYQNGLIKQLQKIPQINTMNLIASSRIESVLDTRLSANVELITKVGDDFKARVKSIVMNNVADGRSYSEIKDQLIETYGITRNKAELISRTETSKLNNSIVTEQARALGSKRAEWDAVLDERSSYHADWDGQEYKYGVGINGEEPGYGHPNCRCTSRPILEIEGD